MDRPLGDERPLGPFSQVLSRGDTELGFIINYGTRFSAQSIDTIREVVEFEFEQEGIPVKEVRVGPERVNDSAMVTVRGDGYNIDDVRSAANSTVTELDDAGVNTAGEPTVEIILQK